MARITGTVVEVTKPIPTPTCIVLRLEATHQRAAIALTFYSHRSLDGDAHWASKRFQVLDFHG